MTHTKQSFPLQITLRPFLTCQEVLNSLVLNINTIYKTALHNIICFQCKNSKKALTKIDWHSLVHTPAIE